MNEAGKKTNNGKIIASGTTSLAANGLKPRTTDIT